MYNDGAAEDNGGSGTDSHGSGNRSGGKGGELNVHRDESGVSLREQLKLQLRALSQGWNVPDDVKRMCMIQAAKVVANKDGVYSTRDIQRARESLRKMHADDIQAKKTLLEVDEKLDLGESKDVHINMPFMPKSENGEECEDG